MAGSGSSARSREAPAATEPAYEQTPMYAPTGEKRKYCMLLSASPHLLRLGVMVRVRHRARGRMRARSRAKVRARARVRVRVRRLAAQRALLLWPRHVRDDHGRLADGVEHEGAEELAQAEAREQGDGARLH